jgi:HlyD family secretion protein
LQHHEWKLGQVWLALVQRLIFAAAVQPLGRERGRFNMHILPKNLYFSPMQMRKEFCWLGTSCLLVCFLALGCGGEAQKEDILASPEEGKFEVVVTTTGELQAENSIDIMGPVGARKAGIYQLKISNLIAEGTIVAPGDFVAELDKSEIVGKIKEVEINLQKLNSQYTQTKLDCTLTLSQTRDELVNLRYALEQRRLEKEESVFEAPSTRRQAEIEYEKAVRAFDQAGVNYITKEKQAAAKMGESEADLNKERQKYDEYQQVMGEFMITAPEQGMVIYAREWDGKKRVVGSTVSPWDPTVATLPDLTKMESITHVNEVDIQKIQVGQQVRLSLDADPDKKLSGVIKSVANIGEQRPNSDSKVFEVKIKVNEKDSTLRPAMTTSNEVMIETIEKALFIPLEAVHSYEDSLTFVYLKDGSKTVRQQVLLGSENENHVVVLKGLKKEDKFYLTLPAEADKLELRRLKP